MGWILPSSFVLGENLRLLKGGGGPTQRNPLFSKLSVRQCTSRFFLPKGIAQGPWVLPQVSRGALFWDDWVLGGWGTQLKVFSGL